MGKYRILDENQWGPKEGFTRQDSAIKICWSSICVILWWGTECAGDFVQPKLTYTWPQWELNSRPPH